MIVRMTKRQIACIDGERIENVEYEDAFVGDDLLGLWRGLCGKLADDTWRFFLERPSWRESILLYAEEVPTENLDRVKLTLDEAETIFRLYKRDGRMLWYKEEKDECSA